MLRRISFIEMNAALHYGYGNRACVADDHLSGMADRGRSRKGGDFVKGNSGSVGKESANPPRPDPRTRPMRGRSEVRCKMDCAAASARGNWSSIEAISLTHCDDNGKARSYRQDLASAAA